MKEKKERKIKMAGLNKVILMGNLTADPEYKTTPSGVGVTTFKIAVGRRFAKESDEVKADFINCVAWRNTAEFVSKYFTKGKGIVVVGSLQTRSWDDQDGKKRYATDVVVNQVYFAESKRDSQSSMGMDDSFAASDFGSLPEPISPMGTDDD
jgi:single-strand DNA-binding protein